MKIICFVSFIVLAVHLSSSGTSAQERSLNFKLLNGYREIVDKYNELKETSGVARHVAIVKLSEILDQSEVLDHIHALPHFARRTLRRIVRKVSYHVKESTEYLHELMDELADKIIFVSEAVRNESEALGDQLQQTVKQLKQRGITSIDVSIEQLVQIFESEEFLEILDKLPEDLQNILIKMYEELVDSEGYNFITDAISNVFDKISNSALVTKIRELITAAKQSVGAARDFAILKLKELLGQDTFKNSLSSLGSTLQGIVEKAITKVTDLAKSASDRVNQMVTKALTHGAVLIEAFKTKTQEITDKLQQGLEQLKEKVLAVQEQGRTIILQVMQNETVQKLLENMSPEVQDAANKLLESLA